MSCARGLVAAVLLAVVLHGDVAAIAVALRDRDIERALKLAQTFDDARARFHAPYVLTVNDPTLERVEVVTEYRRYVLTTEEQLRQGRWLFAQSIKDAQEMLRPWRGRMAILARLRFHPQNTLSALPLYDVTLAGPDLRAVDVVRTPITALRSGRPGDLFAPLMGATIEAVFDAASVAQTVRPVRLSLDGQEVARITIDFAKLE
jgi:hypothetical protein